MVPPPVLAGSSITVPVVPALTKENVAMPDLLAISLLESKDGRFMVTSMKVTKVSLWPNEAFAVKTTASPASTLVGLVMQFLCYLYQ